MIMPNVFVLIWLSGVQMAYLPLSINGIIMTLCDWIIHGMVGFTFLFI